jgi:hypothetical protein
VSAFISTKNESNTVYESLLGVTCAIPEVFSQLNRKSSRFIHDGFPGFTKVLEDFLPHAQSVRDSHHMADNIRDAVGVAGGGPIPLHLWYSAVTATTKLECDKLLAQLNLECPKAFEHIVNSGVGYEKLFVSYALDKYQERTALCNSSNLIEQFFAAQKALGIRHQHPFVVLCGLIEYYNKRYELARRQVQNQVDHGIVLVPQAIVHLDKIVARATEYGAECTCEESLQFMTTHSSDNSTQRSVDLILQECTCYEFPHTGKSCVHIYVCVVEALNLFPEHPFVVQYLSTPEKRIRYLFDIRFHADEVLKGFTKGCAVIIPSLSTLTPLNNVRPVSVKVSVTTNRIHIYPYVSPSPYIC